MDMSQYLDIFIDETREHLQNLNEQILILEKEPENEATVNVEGKLESKGRMTINATATSNLNVDAKTKTSFEKMLDRFVSFLYNPFC